MMRRAVTAPLCITWGACRINGAAARATRWTLTARILLTLSLSKTSGVREHQQCDGQGPLGQMESINGQTGC